MAGHEHVLERGKIHFKWDNSLPPAIEIEPGDVVHCETDEVTSNQVTPGCDASVLANLNFDLVYPLAGPIFVKGAQPGPGTTSSSRRPARSSPGPTSAAISSTPRSALIS